MIFLKALLTPKMIIRVLIGAGILGIIGYVIWYSGQLSDAKDEIVLLNSANKSQSAAINLLNSSIEEKSDILDVIDKIQTENTDALIKKRDALDKVIVEIKAVESGGSFDELEETLNEIIEVSYNEITEASGS